jgi:hypothetical protein
LVLIEKFFDLMVASEKVEELLAVFFTLLAGSSFLALVGYFSSLLF